MLGKLGLRQRRLDRRMVALLEPADFMLSFWSKARAYAFLYRVHVDDLKYPQEL